MLEEFDIFQLRGIGLQFGEEELLDIVLFLVILDEFKVFMLDEFVIIQLVEMGFFMDVCCKVVYYMGNSGVEVVMNWVMLYMDDLDFVNFFILFGFSGLGFISVVVDFFFEDCVIIIVFMGFFWDQVLKVLWVMNNSLEWVVDWIFSYIDDLDVEVVMDILEGCLVVDFIFEFVLVGFKVWDGFGKYQFFVFISYMGILIMCGYYVCYIKKEGRWVIYNDQKVCVFEKLFKDLGYIYFYQRVVS